jgi:tRNA nucleotidyltransferase (CCA-adding enzyme)
MQGHEGFEVTTYRIDGKYEDGRHPSEVVFTRSLREDLQRRDFTINAMAYNGQEGVVDLFGGLEDLEKGLIRAVGDPRQRFSEDALRIMRAVRFAAVFGFAIEDETRAAMEEIAPNLDRISAERINAELTKLLVSPHPELLRTAYEAGLTARFLPELDRCMETVQNNPHHCYTVGEHTIRTVQAVRPDKVLRLAMLLHDIAKPVCKTTDEAGIDHFYGHPDKGARMADGILRRLKYDNDTREKVIRLVRYHDRSMETSPGGIRKAMAFYGTDLFPLLMEVKEADVSAQSMYQREEKMEVIARWKELYRRIREAGDCVSLKDMAVNGNDLIEAGMAPGRELGAVLQAMFEEVLVHPEHNDRDYLMEHFAIIS